MSDLDANQIIKIAHDPKTGALHVNKLNSLVPAAYGKVELNYISVNDEDVIDTATFYGDGEFEVTGIGINDDVAGSLNGSYFLINSANDETEYYVWLNNGTASDPALVGKTGIEVAYNNNDSKHRLSFKLASSLNSVLDFGAEAQADALLITNVTQGETTPTQDNNTGFQFYQIKQGSSRKVVAILQMTYDAFANLIAAERVFYG
jgi:hypothetical protein